MYFADTMSNWLPEKYIAATNASESEGSFAAIAVSLAPSSSVVRSFASAADFDSWAAAAVLITTSINRPMSRWVVPRGRVSMGITFVRGPEDWQFSITATHPPSMFPRRRATFSRQRRAGDRAVRRRRPGRGGDGHAHPMNSGSSSSNFGGARTRAASPEARGSPRRRRAPRRRRPAPRESARRRLRARATWCRRRASRRRRTDDRGARFATVARAEPAGGCRRRWASIAARGPSSRSTCAESASTRLVKRSAATKQPDLDDGHHDRGEGDEAQEDELAPFTPAPSPVPPGRLRAPLDGRRQRLALVLQELAGLLGALPGLLANHLAGVLALRRARTTGRRRPRPGPPG